MRGTTVKRLNVYANYLKNNDKKYENVPLQRIKRGLRRLWRGNADFKKYIMMKVTTEEGQVFIDNNA